MRLDRRGFLAALASAAGAFALDPERALWVPGAKLISIPARCGPRTWREQYAAMRFVRAGLGGMQLMPAPLLKLEHIVEVPDIDEWYAQPAPLRSHPRLGETFQIARRARYTPGDAIQIISRYDYYTRVE